MSSAIRARIGPVQAALQEDRAAISGMSSRVSDRNALDRLSSLLTPDASGWDLLAGLFEADVRSWADNAAEKREEALAFGMSESDAFSYGAAMAEAVPYLELAKYLSGASDSGIEAYKRGAR